MIASRILFLLLLTVSLFASNVIAQQDLARKQLEHKDYDAWNKIERSAISRDGKWALFTIRNGAVDSEVELHLRSLDSKKQYVIERAASAQFSWDSRFALYRITPSKKKAKELKKSANASDARPQAAFQILELATGRLTRLADVKSFQTPEKNGDWVACIRTSSLATEKLKPKAPLVSETYQVTEEGLRRPRKTLKLKKRSSLETPGVTNENSRTVNKATAKSVENNGEAESSTGTPSKLDSTKSSDEKKTKKNGEQLTLINLNSGVQRTYPNVSSFAFSKHGDAIALATSVDLESGNSKHTEKNGQPGNGSKNQVSAKVENENLQPSDGVFIIELGATGKFNSLAKRQIVSGAGNYKNLAFSDDAKQLALICDRDDYSSKVPTWAVYHWTKSSKAAKKIATEGDEGARVGGWGSPNC